MASLAAPDHSCWMFPVDLQRQFDWACTKALIYPLHQQWGSHTAYNGVLPPAHLVLALSAEHWNLQISLSRERHELDARIAPSWLSPTRGFDWRNLWSDLVMSPLDPNQERRGIADVPVIAEPLRSLLEQADLAGALERKAAAGGGYADRFTQTAAELSAVRTPYIPDEKVNLGAFIHCHDLHLRPLLEQHGYVQGPITVRAGALWSIHYFSRKGCLHHSLDTRNKLNEMVFSFRAFAKGEHLFMNQIAKARGGPVYSKRFDPSRFQDDVANLGAYLREHFLAVLDAGHPLR